MPYTDAQKRATNKYNAKAYDRLYPFVPKGRKEEIQAAADTMGETLNEFIVRAIDERMNLVPDHDGQWATITITVTPEQKEFVSQISEELGESVTDYLMNAAISHARRVKKK
jgi:uncharacterized protein (DUF1778 family)